MAAYPGDPYNRAWVWFYGKRTDRYRELFGAQPTESRWLKREPLWSSDRDRELLVLTSSWHHGAARDAFPEFYAAWYTEWDPVARRFGPWVRYRR